MLLSACTIEQQTRGVIASMTTPSSALNWLTTRVFSFKRFAAIVYPLLVYGRNALLFINGRPKLGYEPL